MFRRPFYFIWYFLFLVVHSLAQGICKLKYGCVYYSSQPWVQDALNSELTSSLIEGEWETQILGSKVVQ